MSTGAEPLVAEMTRRRLTLATAESLTCGLVSARLADVPGASSVLLGGVAAYSADVKRDVLGVPSDLIAEYGTVSDECARAMAAGVQRLTGADVAVATTGVAGPSEQEGQPVGRVHVAVAVGDTVSSRALDLSGTRAEIRSATVVAALGDVQAALGDVGNARQAHRC